MHSITTHGGTRRLTVFSSVEEVETTDRESLIGWLASNDPNGCYRDADSIAEFGAPMSHAEAVECVCRQLEIEL